jgi:hypothetical protein
VEAKHEYKASIIVTCISQAILKELQKNLNPIDKRKPLMNLVTDFLQFLFSTMDSVRDSQGLKVSGAPSSVLFFSNVLQEQALILLKAGGTWMSTHTPQIIVGFYVLCLGFSLLIGLKFLKEQKVEIENDKLKQDQNRILREKIMQESSAAFAMLDESEDEH